jgi:hypothetical protein
MCTALSNYCIYRDTMLLLLLLLLLLLVLPLHAQ